MIGTKTITDLIIDPNTIKPGRINIIEAPVSSGKTHFALSVLPRWTTSPEKILYLIDTLNGEMHIQTNILARTIDRNLYAFYDYNHKCIWGDNDAENLMPVMTYQGFGSELLKFDSDFKWRDFDFIICDEMQNLVNYKNIHEKGKPPSPYLISAENALHEIARIGKTKIVALSATPEEIYEHFGGLCYEVPMDRSDIRRLETFHNIPYSGKVEEILDGIAAKPKPMTGILYTTQVADMKRYIEYVKSIEGEPVLVQFVEATQLDTIYYMTNPCGISCLLGYGFKDDKLYSTGYASASTHTQGFAYVNDYETFKEALTQKYGKPIKEQTVWSSDLDAQYYADDITHALKYGKLQYEAYWETERSHIEMILGSQNYVIGLVIRYENKIFDDTAPDYSKDF